MKEERIISFTGFYACLIMSNTSDNDLFSWFWIGFAILWLARYIHLTRNL